MVDALKNAKTDVSSRVQLVEFNPSDRFEGFSYYEYKYLVDNSDLAQVRQLMEESYGGSDPFASGVVDSIYYDTPGEKLLSQCVNGESIKAKFRIRGYGDGTYNQVHHKGKDLCSVSKYKSPIQIVSAAMELAPEWDTLRPRGPDKRFDVIMFNARRYGPLFPSIRVKYLRYRYRSYDFRMTLDTHIEVYSPSNGLPRTRTYATLPCHVLELKTTQVRPQLPFIGLLNLQQVSFSKFMLGLEILKGL